MSGFVDIHAHFVYGVDDGAQTRQDMLSMLDAAHEQGVTRLFATSHATPGARPFPQETYDSHLAEARDYCAEKGYDLTLYPGAEILYTPLMAGVALERELPTLGDTGWILMEFMPDIPARELERAVECASRAGYSTLLAHIERYECMAHGSLLRRLRESYPVRFQVNCSTVLNAGGFFRRRMIDRWFSDGLVDAVASDMHNCTSRPEKLAAAYESLASRFGTSEADRLTGRDGELFDGESSLFGE